MAHSWPDESRFSRVLLPVLDRKCGFCMEETQIKTYKRRPVHTLEGPVRLVSEVTVCETEGCPGHYELLRAEQEMMIAPPLWVLGWDAFVHLGHARLARHLSVPEIREELADGYDIFVSDDCIEDYIGRYQAIVAARQRDPEQLRKDYESIDDLELSIDGLQPEKGHETLYTVRELKGKRVWFAATLLSSSYEEVEKLIIQANEWAERLGKRIRAWMSDKQDAFVKAIAKICPGVPHRYCQNHFLRDVAAPMLELDSHVKVQMRRKVRGLRTIEKELLARQAGPAQGPEKEVPREEAKSVAPTAVMVAGSSGPEPRDGGSDQSTGRNIVAESAVSTGSDSPAVECSPCVTRSEETKQVSEGDNVVLTYCTAVRGILNKNQGGPLDPPGLRMADALKGVRESIQTNIDMQAGGMVERDLKRLAGCIDRGLELVAPDLAKIPDYVKDVTEIHRTLDPKKGKTEKRQAKFHELQQRFEADADPVRHSMGTVMKSFEPGLFAGGDALASLQDNLELERFFRLPKLHERKIHGHQHAGVRIVHEGPGLLLALDAHSSHRRPFTVEELSPYLGARPTNEELEAVERRKIMRRATSRTALPILLKDLERRYRSAISEEQPRERCI